MPPLAESLLKQTEKTKINNFLFLIHICNINFATNRFKRESQSAHLDLLSNDAYNQRCKHTKN